MGNARGAHPPHQRGYARHLSDTSVTHATSIDACGAHPPHQRGYARHLSDTSVTHATSIDACGAHPTHHGRYLSKFADTFNLRPHIRFGRKVTRLTPLLPACDDTAAVPEGAGGAGGVRGFAGTAWTVEHREAATGEGVVREEFDVVMVCICMHMYIYT